MTSDRLRLLILAPSPPTSSGAHGSAVVMASLARHLADVHEIALVYLRAAHEPPVDDEVRRRCDVVVEVPRAELPPRAAQWQRIKGLVRGRPSWAAEWAGLDLRQPLRDLAVEWRPQLVHVHFPVMGQFVDALAGVPRVLIVYEPATERAREAIGGSARHRALATADFLAWRHFERSVVAASDTVVVLTERDRAALASLGTSTPIAVIPLGTAIPKEPLDPVGSLQGVVLFFGNFGHAPNADAARTLIRLWPLVRQSQPDAMLEIVGPNPPDDICTDERSGIHVTGAVPDLVPHLDRASVVAAPLREGGGMRVKVLETLAAGKALVASPLAVEGLGDAGGSIAVVDRDEALVEALVGLLRDPAARRDRAQGARAFAEQNLGWSSRVAEYAHLDEALAASGLATTEHDHQKVSREST